MAKTGEFRSDLFYRLNVLTLVLPPLRDRLEDIPLLSNYFLKKTAHRFGKREAKLTTSALDTLEEYEWPGNIRELRYLIERAALLSSSETIDVLDLGLSEHISKNIEELPPAKSMITDTTLPRAESAMIERTLLKTGGNVSRAARILGITRMAMRYRMKKHGINPS